MAVIVIFGFIWYGFALYTVWIVYIYYHVEYGVMTIIVIFGMVQFGFVLHDIVCRYSLFELPCKIWGF